MRIFSRFRFFRFSFDFFDFRRFFSGSSFPISTFSPLSFSSLAAPRGLSPSSTAREAIFDALSVATRAALRGRRARTTVAAAAAGAAAGEMADAGDWSDDDKGAAPSSPLGTTARAPAVSEDAEAIHEGWRLREAGGEGEEEELKRREEGQRRRGGGGGRAASGGGAVLSDVDACGCITAAAELPEASDRILLVLKTACQLTTPGMEEKAEERESLSSQFLEQLKKRQKKSKLSTFSLSLDFFFFFFHRNSSAVPAFTWVPKGDTRTEKEKDCAQRGKGEKEVGSRIKVIRGGFFF